MSKKPKAEQDTEEPNGGLDHLEGEPVEIFTLADAPESPVETPPESLPAKQYRVIARGGFWDGVKLHPKGSVVTYSGPVKEDSESLKPL